MERWGQALMWLAAGIGVPIAIPIALSGGGLGLAGDTGGWMAVGSAFVFVVGLILFLVAQSANPHLVLHAFHVEQVSFGFPVDVLCMRLLNRPKKREKGATATGVTARFRLEGTGTEQLPQLDARWSDTPQPSRLQPNEVPQLAVEVNAGGQRQINLVIKEPGSEDGYLFNNDSYNYSRGQNPAWRIGPGDYRAVVKVSADGLKTRAFECRFANRGSGGPLEVISFGELLRRDLRSHDDEPEASQSIILAGRIEVAIDPEDSFEEFDPEDRFSVMLAPAASSNREGTELDLTNVRASLSHIRVRNHSAQSVTIERIRLDIVGTSPWHAPSNTTELSGETRIEANDYHDFRLYTNFVVKGLVPMEDAPSKVHLVVEPVGMPPVRCPIPRKFFR